MMKKINTRNSSTWVLALIGLASVSILQAGCSICCGPYDREYESFGGIVERANPEYGRVGSIFSDPLVTNGPSADSNLNVYGSEERREREMRRRSRSRELLDEGESAEPLVRPEDLDPEPTPGAVDTARPSWRSRPFQR